MTKETKMTPVSAETRAALGEVLAAFEAFKEANDARLDELDAKASSDVLLDDKVARIDAALTQQKSALDRLLLDRARPGLDGAAANAGSAAWSDYMRRGDAAGLNEAKSASAGSDADGGYVVPAETEARIDRLLTEASPIRAIASLCAASSRSSLPASNRA